jgi:hypothetical protein
MVLFTSRIKKCRQRRLDRPVSPDSVKAARADGCAANGGGSVATAKAHLPNPLFHGNSAREIGVAAAPGGQATELLATQTIDRPLKHEEGL